jgi:hypothetical protein
MSNSKRSNSIRFNPTWLECVKTELLSRKLPRQEVARLVAELDDHLSDLADSLGNASSRPAAGTPFFYPPSLKKVPMSTEAIAVDCLGSPAEIADTAVHEFRRRKNLLSRSRLAAFSTFVLLPLPLLVVAWLLSMTATGISLELAHSGLVWSGVIPASQAGTAESEGDYFLEDQFLEDRLRNATTFEFTLMHLILTALLFIPAAGVAALYGRIARRTSRRWLWGLTACTLVGLGFGAAQYDLSISEYTGKSQLGFMLGIGREPLKQCCYSLLPLAVGVLALRRTARNSELA